LPQRVQASIVASIRAFTASMNPPPPSAIIRSPLRHQKVTQFKRVPKSSFRGIAQR
jgi:hypothetical protein